MSLIITLNLILDYRELEKKKSFEIEKTNDLAMKSIESCKDELSDLF